jgi:hypothetical protein
MLVEELRSVILHFINQQAHSKEYAQSYGLRLGLPYDHVNQRPHLRPRRIPKSKMTNTTNTGRTVRTEVADEVEDEVLEPIGAETIGDIGVDIVVDIVGDTEEALNRRNATFVTKLAAGLLNTRSRSARRRTRSSGNKLPIPRNKRLPCRNTVAFLPNLKDSKGLRTKDQTLTNLRP